MSNLVVMSRISVSGIAVGQFKEMTNNNKNAKKHEAEAKILRAIVLGRPVFRYKSGEVIMRYFDINLLVNTHGIVASIWRHRDYKIIKINPLYKEHLKQTASHKDLEQLALNRMEKVFKMDTIRKQGIWRKN